MQTTGDPMTEIGDQYQRQVLAIRAAFEAGTATGSQTIAARAEAMDTLVQALWNAAAAQSPRLASGVALLAVGGYGRRELFPYSDVDLLFLLDSKVAEKDVKDSIRKVSQQLWDLGVRISPTTRKITECERFDPDLAEFMFSLMDARCLAGDTALFQRLSQQILPRVLQRDNKAILSRLIELTNIRHARYGDTLFHLEPNIKDCPGGLRDVHVCHWITMLEAARDGGQPASGPASISEEEYRSAVEFLYRVRCFLHYRNERDNNTLDWQAQDAAAAAAIGLDGGRAGDAAYWMRIYFRNARSIERRASRMMEEVSVVNAPPGRFALLRRKKAAEVVGQGYRLNQGRIVFDPPESASDPAHDPDIVLGAFAFAAESGAVLSHEAEERLSNALPYLSANLEEGAALWNPLRRILTGRRAGATLRSMHALGILDLLIPEFHGIDALVIRDAYHRYTVDEHTFVLIDTLHHLESPQEGSLSEWASKLRSLLRDIPHPELLYLSALLHDTGKGRSSDDHAKESARMAAGVLARLELDAYESGLVLALIENHLAMSAALRRDIFDAETVEAFAGKVMTPEALRMLTLFTYADINAVHPDALTPWKAENIWRLYMATSNYLDRSVEDERISSQDESELVHRIAALLPGRRTELGQYLEGFPERYLRTKSPEQIRRHYGMSLRFAEDPVQLDFRYAPAVSEIALVTMDRPQLFASMAGALAAWGMNIVSADAFSNSRGVVVDSFRFTDTFRTLEMNASEHEAFVQSVHDVMSGTVPLDRLLSGRRRARRRAPMVVVEPRVDFDDEASSHSTLLQVVAQDVPGLLRALSLTLAAHGCNIEAALVDTEGETAIDVFYVTKTRAKLQPEEQEGLRQALLEAMEANQR
ncbi:MAG TPA: [protein-PII] uridylyltransferase [Granulicella sp.]